MYDLVISHYNENLDWISYVDKSKFKIIIYHKFHSENLDVYNKSIRINNNEYLLGNIGREAHTYLFHIVNNYNDLSDIQIFSQGNPFDHCFNFFDELKNISNEIDFKQLGNLETVIYRNEIKKSICDFNFKYLNNLIQKDPNWTRANFFHIDSIHLDLFGQEMPEQSYMKPYAQFAVSKQCIHRHSKETYKRLLEYFNDNKNMNVMAWHLEYFWHLLFRDAQHLKYNSKNHIFNL